MPDRALNWYAGWTLILSAFVTGAIIGVFFHRDDFWGGYNSFRRRIVRLGHISQAALGILNVLYSLSSAPVSGSDESRTASWCFVAGGVAMPLVCFFSGWNEKLRYLFFLPVALLIVAAIATLREGAP